MAFNEILSKASPYTAAASAAIQFGKGIFDLADSIRKKRAANRLERRTNRPVYNMPEEIRAAAELAESEVNNSSVADFYTQNASQGLSQGIDAILKSGGAADFSTINNSYGAQLRAALNTLNQDRAKKIAAVQEANYAVAKAKDTEFQYNKHAPYADAKQRIAELRKQAADAKAGFFTNTSGALANIATMGKKPDAFDKNGADGATNENQITTVLPSAQITRVAAPAQPNYGATGPETYEQWLANVGEQDDQAARDYWWQTIGSKR